MSIFSTDQPKNYKLIPVCGYGDGAGANGDVYSKEEIDNLLKKYAKSSNALPTPSVDYKNSVYFNSDNNTFYTCEETPSGAYEWVPCSSSESSSGDKYIDTSGSTVAVGGIAKGYKTSATGTPTKDVLYTMLHPHQGPKVTISPTSTFKEVGETMTTVPITATVSKGQSNIVSIVLKKGNTILQTLNTNVANGGTFNFSDQNLSASATYTCVVTDEDGASASATYTVTFGRYVFYGSNLEQVESATSDDIRNCSEKIYCPPGKTTTFDAVFKQGDFRMTIAAPSNLTVESIKYVEAGNIEHLNVFSDKKKTFAVNGANGLSSTEYTIYEYISLKPFPNKATFAVTIK